MKGVFGRKVGMTQVFTPEGDVRAVTVVRVGPCTVIRKKSTEGKDGYAAIVLGFEDARSAEVDGETLYKVSKPHEGLFKAADIEVPKKIVREVRLDEADLANYEVGQALGAELFTEGEVVDVTGTSKGRGFAGVMKRHNMHGAKASHGVHEYFRHGGSIGTSATPGRVFKGKKMPGQYGNTRVTVQNIKVVEVIKDENLVLLHGAIPGPTGSLVMIRDAAKRRRRSPQS